MELFKRNFSFGNRLFTIDSNTTDSVVPLHVAQYLTYNRYSIWASIYSLPEPPSTQLGLSFSSWSPVARALSDLICPVTNGEILGVMYQLVGQDIRPDSNLEDRCEYLEHMLLRAGYLRCSGKGYKEIQRVAVIHGFFRRIFPQFLTTGFEVTTREGPPDSDKVTRYAARLGLYLQSTKLQSLRWWLTIESCWNTLEMSIDTWLCPHCALKFEDASKRWSHIYALHSRRVMFPECFE